MLSDDADLTSSPTWWKTLDLFGFISQFRMELEHLARLLAFPHSKQTMNLSFLAEEGTAQMAITFFRFPTFSHQVWGVMGRSGHASCGFQVRPNGDRKRTVFVDGTLHQAETEMGISPCCSISRRTTSLDDRERDGSQGHAFRAHTWVVGSGIEGIPGPGTIEEG